ncbi:hypothetical protein ACFVMC_13515 [Nocardia sp. NPDC127579]|uniref:hypothetical protein n=1 Tax=Nocardia sp. NPDC127579 TaxID=3345402 RepID=UPI003642D0C6
MGGTGPKRSSERWFAVALALVCLVVGCFFLRALVDLPGHAARGLGATWAGWGDSAGTITVTQKKRGSGRSSEIICRGDFTPDDGGPVRSTIRVSVESCVPGRQVRAELVKGDPGNWNSANRADTAFEPGQGWGSLLFVTVFIGAFCLVLGSLFGLGGIAVLVGAFRPTRGLAADPSEN